MPLKIWARFEWSIIEFGAQLGWFKNSVFGEDQFEHTGSIIYKYHILVINPKRREVLLINYNRFRQNNNGIQVFLHTTRRNNCINRTVKSSSYFKNIFSFELYEIFLK